MEPRLSFLPQHQQNQHQLQQQQRLTFLPHRPPLPRSSSGAPLPSDHYDLASFLAYRQRVNDSLAPHPSTGFARTQNAPWDPPIRGTAFGPDAAFALDDYRHGLARDFDRRIPSRERRDDVRRSDSALSELASSQRSAVLSARLFLDEGRPGGAAIQRSAVYEDSRRRSERDEAYYDPKFVKRNPTFRKRSREEDSDFERERITRQRRVYDPGLAALAIGGGPSLHLKRTPETFGDPPILRRDLSSGRTRDVEDRQHGQFNSSSRALSPNVRQIPSFTSPTKPNKKKHSAQHITRGRTSPPEGRFSSPRSESRASLPQRFDDTEGKFPVTNTSGYPSGPGTNLQTRGSPFRETGARDKAGVLSPNLRQLSSAKRETRGGRNQKLGRLMYSEPSSGQKKSKKMAVGVGSTPEKDRDYSSSKRHQVASAQKGHILSRSNGKSSKVVETTPRRTVKSRVIRLIGSNAEASGGSLKSRQGDLDDDKGGAFELHPEESNPRSCEGLDKAPAVQQGDKASPSNDVLQEEVGTHDETSVSDQCPIHVHNEHVPTIVEDLSLFQPLELPVAASLQHQNLLSPSEYRSGAPYEKSSSPRNSHSIVHSQPSLNISEVSCPRPRLLETEFLFSDVLSETLGLPSTLDSSLLSSTSFPEIKPLISSMQQNDRLTIHEETAPSLHQDSFLQATGHFKLNSSPLSLHIECGAKASDQSGEEESRQTNSLLPVSLGIESFIQTGLSQPDKQCTPRSTKETINHPCMDVLRGDIQSLAHAATVGNIQSHMGLAHCLEHLNPISIKENRSFFYPPVFASHDKIGEITLQSDDVQQGLEGTFDNTARETTAEREFWLFGKSLKAPVADRNPQPEEALPGVDASSNRNVKPALSIPESQSEQRGDAAVAPDMVSAETGLTAVNTSREQTYISGAGRPGDGNVILEAAPSVSQDKLINSAPPKQFPTVAHQPRGRVVPSPARAGAHTWHRTTMVNNFTGAQAMTKAMKGSTTNHISQASGKQKAPQLASYVRKGNSLVRASVSSMLVNTPQEKTVPLQVPGKDVAGKVFPNLARAQRMYPSFRNTLRNSRGTFRKVFSARKMPLIESTPSEKPSTVPHAAGISILQDVMSAGLSDSLAMSTRPVTPESQPNAHFHAKSLEDDESIQQRMQSFKPQVVEDSHGSVESASAKAVSLVATTVLQPKPPYPGIQPNGGGPNNAEACSTQYVKSRANQLIASKPPFSSLGLITRGQVGSSHSGLTAQEFYYKRNNNQLVRNGTEVNDASMKPLPKGGTMYATRGRADAILRTTLGKAFRQRRTHLPSSWVWTLNGRATSQVKGVLPLLFPWKRPGLGVPGQAGRFKALPKAKKGSLLFLISKKLQRLRKLQPVYTRSAGGFSLHRSGVLSLGGANLKWTKSIEKRSKQASEEATKAVAAVEKKRRKEQEAVAEAVNAVAKAKADRRAARQASRGSKLRPRERIVMVGLVRYKMDATQRTLQRLPDQWPHSGNEASNIKQGIDSTILSTPRRLSIGGTEYVRVGSGHQLVRDPKAASRALASEKVRWSLHTARFRRAKRQQYCLFFTRFGKCNKSEGECPYIHDPEKVAVCTKFLKGTCSVTNCLLTHRVIPERMPDCSFFLEGLCTNEDCPYRHVSVNPNAPICEGFLKGYCVDGDECNKKHTTVCPTFAATGECSDNSTCKLQHPKKERKKFLCLNSRRVGMKRKRRYFVTSTLGLSKQEGNDLPVRKETQGHNCNALDADSSDFIELPSIEIDMDETDDFRRKLATLKDKLPLLQEDFQNGEADVWIKPVLLLQRHPDSISA